MVSPQFEIARRRCGSHAAPKFFINSGQTHQSFWLAFVNRFLELLLLR
jgi:hypothetical protein